MRLKRKQEYKTQRLKERIDEDNKRYEEFLAKKKLIMQEKYYESMLN